MARKKPPPPTFEELQAHIERICRRLLAQTAPEVRDRTCEVALWAYYPHLKLAATLGHLLWDGEHAAHIQPLHNAPDLFQPPTIRNALREHYLYLRLRTPDADGGFVVDYLFPGYEIRRFRVASPEQAERVYYDAEVLLPQIAAQKPS